MRSLRTVFSEILGLFVDDGSLALAILALVGVVAILTLLQAFPPWIQGGILFGGSVVILAENLLRSTRRG